MPELVGRRVETIGEVYDGEAGVYCLVVNRDSGEDRHVLWFRGPTGEIGRVEKHEIREEEDSTITVSPSILATRPAHGHDWHGFLEHGVWRDA